MVASRAGMPGLLRRMLRNEVLLCLVALALLVCTLHREVLFGGRVYHMDDAADSYYPGHIAVARAFAHGELPTWEPTSWSGWPLIVDPYNGVFYPLNVLYYLVGAARGLGYAVALHVLLGGAGMLWLLRRRRLSAGAALFGAVAFALSTFFVVRIRHVIFVQMTAWLPFILVGVEGWIAERRRRWLLLAAASTGLALVAGALSIGHFAALVVGVYTVARAASASRPGRWLADLGALAGAALLGALCAAAQLVPTVAHLPWSPRALGSDYTFASSYAWPILRYAMTLLAPDYYGTEDRMRYFGAPNHWELCGWYVGALCVALAPAALLPRRRDEVRRVGAETWALAAVVLLAIALALGDAGPVHRFFFLHLPLYAALRCPARALLMAVVALPILGAQGAEALVGALDLRRWLRARATLVTAIGAAIALAAIAVGAAAAHVFRVAPGAPPAAQVTPMALAHLSLVFGLGAAVVGLGVVGAAPRRVVMAGLVALLAWDLFHVERPYLRPEPADYPAGMERFAAIEWLRAHAGDARFVNDPRGPFRLHNVGMVVGLENASGYDSVAIWRYVELLYLVNNGHRYPEKKLKHDFAGIGVWNLSSRILDLLHVRWLVAENAPDEGRRWIERFRPHAPTGAPAARYEPMWDADLRVFESPSVLPRAFLVYRAEVPGSDDALARRMVDPAFDPARVALLEAPPRVPLPATPDGPPPTPATIVARARDRLALDVDAAAPAMLVTSEVFYPGWSATVDGQPAPVERVDWTLRGVSLRPGRHHVELRFASRPTQLGMALSLAGLLGLVALGAWRRGTGRTRVV